MDLDVAEEDTSDLLREVQKQLKKREHGGVMRLEIESSMHNRLKSRLIETLDVDKKAVYEINGPIDLTFLKKLPGLIEGHPELRYSKFKPFVDPALANNKNFFTQIRKKISSCTIPMILSVLL